jgi:transposase
MDSKAPLTKELLQNLSKDEIIEIVLLQSAQINALVVRVAELEERLNQNSTNSSQPSSSDKPWNPRPRSQREKSDKKRGGQEHHKGHGPRLQYTIKETVRIDPERCSCCGENLRDVHGAKGETRYVHDIPNVEITTTAYEAQEKICPHCGTVTSGAFPESVTGTQQYGPNVKALILLLSQFCMTAFNKITNFLDSLYGIKISEATIANTIKTGAKHLKDAQESIKAAVEKAKVVHFDETGMKNSGVLWWLHTASTKGLTYLRIHPKRGKEAMDALGVFEKFAGIAVHDCLRSYWAYGCFHALCNAHALRELKGVFENTIQEWAPKMIALLLEMKCMVDFYKTMGCTELPDYYHKKFGGEYDQLVLEGLAINPLLPKTPGKKGVAKQTKTRRLLERFRDHKKEWLLFTHDFNVPFDNNQAERDFRISKNKQKNSGGFRSDSGAESFATIQSIIQTLRKHRSNIFNELVKAFQGKYALPFDLEPTE